MSSTNPLHVLRVKLWLEEAGSPQTQEKAFEWRGEIHRLETGDTAYFRHLSGFKESIKRVGIDDEGSD